MENDDGVDNNNDDDDDDDGGVSNEGFPAGYDASSKKPPLH